MTKLTRAQINAIIYACDNASEREREHAKIMLENHPERKDQIERDEALYLLGVQTAYYQIMRAFGEI